MASKTSARKSNIETIVLRNWALGGIADSDFGGYPDSLASMVGFNPHQEVGILKVNQKLAKESSTTVTEFVKVAVACSDTNSYWFSSESGKIWKRTYAGSWSLIHTTTATNGENKILSAEEFGGYLYWTTQNWLHRIPVNRTSDWATYAEDNWKSLAFMDVVSPKASYVANFDGVDDYAVTTAYDMALTNDNIFSFSVWFKASEDSHGGTENHTIWGADDVASQLQVQVGGSAGSDALNRIRVMAGNTIVAETVSNVWSKNTWTHLVYTRSGTGAGTHKIYINGIEQPLVTDGATNFTTSSCVKYIGRRTSLTDGTEQYFKGHMAQLRIFDSALSAQNVLDMYNHATVSAGLHHYPMGGGFEDLGSADKDGTATSGANFVTDSDLTGFIFRCLIPSALAESAVNKIYFRPTQPTLVYVKVYISTVGTGDWTVTVHNSSNTSIGSKQVTNGSLALGWNTFTFSSPLTMDLDEEYHIHVHSSVADGAVVTTRHQVFDGTNMELYSVGDSEYHDMKLVNARLFIGERNFIHKVSKEVGGHAFELQVLDIRPPFRVKTLEKWANQLLIGTVIADTVDKATMVRWDTWSVSYNSEVEIDQCGINAIIPAGNTVIVNLGKEGWLYQYDGYQLVPLKQIKGTYSSSKTGAINPNATAIMNGIPLFGFSNITGDPALQGIYSFGMRSLQYPRILALEYPMSPRSSGNDYDLVLSGMEIGAVLVISGKIIASWRQTIPGTPDTYAYGVDVLDTTTKLSGAYFESRITLSNRQLLHRYTKALVNYRSLPANTSIKMFSRKNYGDYNSGTTMTPDVNRLYTELKSTIAGTTLQFKFVEYSNSNNAPEIESVYIFPSSEN